jgi:hypothetical protein
MLTALAYRTVLLLPVTEAISQHHRALEQVADVAYFGHQKINVWQEVSFMAGSRALLKGEPPVLEKADIVYVETPEQLVSGLAAGSPHIVVQAHLDLTELPTLENGLLRSLKSTVKSIRVRSTIFGVF